jgi:hypothetical protein
MAILELRMAFSVIPSILSFKSTSGSLIPALAALYAISLKAFNTSSVVVDVKNANASYLAKAAFPS